MGRPDAYFDLEYPAAAELGRALLKAAGAFPGPAYSIAPGVQPAPAQAPKASAPWAALGWERVASGVVVGEDPTYRLAVPGGWLYQVGGGGPVYVPAPTTNNTMFVQK